VASGTHRFLTARFFATDSNNHRAACWQVAYLFSFSDRIGLAMAHAHLASSFVASGCTHEHCLEAYRRT
jgi:hypothetical protein